MVSINEEVFLPIKNFDNYMVSNLGNVKNATTNKILKQSANKEGYIRLKIYKNGKRYGKYVHKLIAEAFLINDDNKPNVDHIDNNKLNNNINNLRFATHIENSRNRSIPINNTSSVKGVCKSGNKWRAYICIDGIRMHLGVFETIEDAKLARITAVKKAFGEFANKCECESN